MFMYNIVWPYFKLCMNCRYTFAYCHHPVFFANLEIHVWASNVVSDYYSWQTSVLMYISNDTGPQLGHTYVDLYMDLQPPSGASRGKVAAFFACIRDCVVWRVFTKHEHPDSFIWKCLLNHLPWLIQVHAHILIAEWGGQHVISGKLITKFINCWLTFWECWLIWKKDFMKDLGFFRKKGRKIHVLRIKIK